MDEFEGVWDYSKENEWGIKYSSNSLVIESIPVCGPLSF